MGNHEGDAACLRTAETKQRTGCRNNFFSNRSDYDKITLRHSKQGLPERRRKYDGFGKAEGLVYLSAGKQTIITDFRYTEQAEHQASAFAVMEVSQERDHNHCLAELVREDQITELRFEANYISVESFEKLRGAVGEGVSFVPLNKAPQKLRRSCRRFTRE